MPDLRFAVEGARAVEHAASPLVALSLRVTNARAGEPVRSVLLQSQVKIEAAARDYDAAESAKLTDLFGERRRWGATLTSLLWGHVTTVVPEFTGEAVVDLLLPCTFDFNVATTKLLDALAGGAIPLLVQFSGTVFYDDAPRGLQVARVPWDREARYALAVATWREAVARHYPNTAVVALRKDVFDRLNAFKTRGAHATWEDAVARLLDRAEGGGS